jgi:hypothetical protein
LNKTRRNIKKRGDLSIDALELKIKARNELLCNEYVYIFSTSKESMQMMGVNHIILFKSSIDKMSINIKKENSFSFKKKEKKEIVHNH